MAHTYDAIIIGTGQAGPSLAAELSAAGMRTAVIERHLFRGTCVNVGCIPTKALMASARAAEFGVVIGGVVGVDMARVKKHKDAIVVVGGGCMGAGVGSHLLLAVGRRPNTDYRGLETTGIEVDARGLIHVDDALQTGVPGVWALGEYNGRGAFTHTAYHDYEIIDCYGLYIDPPLGRVGMTDPQVRASGRPVLVATPPCPASGVPWKRARRRAS